MRVLFNQVEQLHLQTLNLSLLVVQSQFNLLNLLLDQAELLICQILILWTEVVKVELLLLPPRSVHLPLPFIYRHVQNFVEVWNSLQNPCFDYVKHHCVLQFDGEFISVGLIFA